VLDCDVVFRQEIRPPPLLANGFWRLHEVSKGSMVCADDDGSLQQMLPILLEPIHHAQEFLARDAVASFRM